MSDFGKGRSPASNLTDFPFRKQPLAAVRCVLPLLARTMCVVSTREAGEFSQGLLLHSVIGGLDWDVRGRQAGFVE